MERANIFRDGFNRFGYTVGCQGCRAAVKGEAAQSHTEERRRRIEDELRKENNKRVNMRGSRKQPTIRNMRQRKYMLKS